MKERDESGRLRAGRRCLPGGRKGGKRGRGAQGKTPFVAHTECWKRSDGGRTSDGLACFRGVNLAFCEHRPRVTGGGDSQPVKPLQHLLHRQGITEPTIQFIPIIATHRMFGRGSDGGRDIDFPTSPNHSNTFIAKGLQNRQSNLFQLFNIVSRLPQDCSRDGIMWNYTSLEYVERNSE